MKPLLIVLGMIFLLTFCAARPKNVKFHQISMEQAVPMLQEQDGHLLLDVRTKEEFSEGHIPNAVNLPNETIGTAMLPQLPDKDQRIFVYCRSGNRSRQAAAKLVKLGYTNMIEIGGIIDWHGEIVTD